MNEKIYGVGKGNLFISCRPAPKPKFIDIIMTHLYKGEEYIGKEGFTTIDKCDDRLYITLNKSQCKEIISAFNKILNCYDS